MELLSGLFVILPDMDIKKFVKNVVGVTGNDTHHSSRYRDLYGASYGAKGIANFILVPATPLNLGLVALYGASNAILSNNIANAISLEVLTSLPALAIAHVIAKASFYNNVPIDREAAIDTQGKEFSPVAHIKMMQCYRKEAIKGGISYIGAGGFLSLFFGPTAFIAAAYYAMPGLFYLRAYKNLKAGKWTIIGEPPKRRVRRKQTQSHKVRLQPAFG